MKPTIVCDIDCTLYSYSEFIKTNFLHPGESLLALFSKGSSFPAIERTWNAYQGHIEQRVSVLLEVARPHGNVLFLSAFPAEPYKLQSFKKLALEMTSSFPGRKIDLLKKSNDLKVILTIGDRPNDKGLSKAFNSKLIYLPIYNPIHALSGTSYTKKLIQKVKEKLDS